MTEHERRASDIMKKEWEEFERYFAGIHRFNSPMLVDVVGKILEKTKVFQSSETHSAEKQWVLYGAKRGEGQRPIYIDVPLSQSLSEGDQSLYLKPMEIDSERDLLMVFSKKGLPQFAEESGMHKICKSLGIAERDEEGKRKSLEEICKDITYLHKRNDLSVFYELTTPIPLEELQKCDDIDGIIEMALRDNCQKDDDLVLVTRSSIPIHDPSRVRPQDVQPFSPHTIWDTGTKAGKTTLAAIIGKYVEGATISGLLGWSDTRRRVIGILCDRREHLHIDEIEETKEGEEAAAGLLNFLELGEVERPRGRGNLTRGYCSVTFAANPPPGEVDEYLSSLDYLALFQTMLERVTKNPLAFGSRIALTIFNPETTPVVEGPPLPRAVKENAQKVLKTIQVGLAPHYTDAVLNDDIRLWLTQPHDEEIVKEFKNASEVIDIPYVSLFLKGQVYNNKHFRGMAFNLAWLEYVPKVIAMWPEVRINFNELKGLADKWYDVCKDLALKYLAKLRKVRTEDDYFNKIYAAKLANQSPDYLRLLIRAALLWAVDNSAPLLAAEVDRIPMNVLEPYFSEVRDVDGYYRSFERVMERIRTSLERTNARLVSYGFRIDKLGEDYLLKVSNRDTIEALCKSEDVITVAKCGDYHSHHSHPKDPNQDRNDKNDDGHTTDDYGSGDRNDKNDKGTYEEKELDSPSSLCRRVLNIIKEYESEEGADYRDIMKETDEPRELIDSA
ncbi:MAG: hypothetical protein KAU99_02165, partial [Thermoplasmata archaeon]|nr:hypothetical protein [Thermoplasmata archaeon]